MLHRKTLAEQTAEYLVEGLRDGRWRGELPGVNRLSEEFGVSRETVRAALRQVQNQGLLERRGAGRPRVVTADGNARAKKSLRVVVLLHDRFENDSCNFQGLLLRIRHNLEEAGHFCEFALKCQAELGLDVERIRRMVMRTAADAWVVVGGSQDLLQWFVDQALPAIAVGGRLKGVAIAAAFLDVTPAFREVFHHLIEIGHRRITLLGPPERRVPDLSPIEKALKEELAARNTPFSEFNAPNWEPTLGGLTNQLNALFQVTRPTVIQVTVPEWAIGVLAFLNRRGLRVPEDVSLICETMDNTLAWYRPAIAHFSANYDLIVRRVGRWANAIALGKHDCKQVSSLPDFHPGSSILPPTDRLR